MRVSSLNITASRALGMKEIFRYTVLQVGNQKLYKGQCIYLMNHRSWADFLVDQYTTHGRAMFMSRWAVFFAFPVFLTACKAMGGLLLFKRGSVGDKAKFNAWIDKEIAKSQQSAIAVYPEGHRSTLSESLPLKRGMLRYAYERKMPVQIIIGSNKEAILSERHCTARLGQTVAVGYSDMIDPSAYGDFEKFMDKVQSLWDQQWNTVYSADWESLEVMAHGRADIEYCTSERLLLLFIYGVSTILFIGTLVAMYSLGRAVFAIFGHYELHAMSLFLLYVAASFWVFSTPVDAITVHARLMKEAKRKSRLVPAQSDAAFLKNQ